MIYPNKVFDKHKPIKAKIFPSLLSAKKPIPSHPSRRRRHGRRRRRRRKPNLLAGAPSSLHPAEEASGGAIRAAIGGAGEKGGAFAGHGGRRVFAGEGLVGG